MTRNMHVWFAIFVVVVFGAGTGTVFLLRPYVESTPQPAHSIHHR